MLGNDVVPGYMIDSFLNAFRQTHSHHDARHVEQGIRMTEEDKMQRDYEELLQTNLSNLHKINQLNADKEVLASKVEDRSSDLKAASKLRRSHESTIKRLRALLDHSRIQAYTEAVMRERDALDRDVENLLHQENTAKKRLTELGIDEFTYP